MRYSPWVVSEHVPDTSTLENLVSSPRFASLKDEALAVALWRYMVDRELGIFHYCPPQEPFWKKDCHDPLLIFNVYGFTICHVHAHVLAMLARAAGMKARVANIHGHEGTEIFYSGGWHYFDADVQYFHRKREPPYAIASREELYRDPSLFDDQPRPSTPYGIPDRPPEKFRKLYESAPEYPELLEEKIHSMDFVLRPGEEMVRYFHHRGRWHVFENYPEMFKQYPSETGPEGPTERFWPRRQWGNGYLRYCPKLHPDYVDFEAGARLITNLKTTERGAECISGGGEVLFTLRSPYTFCGVPDPLRRVPAVDGATLNLSLDIASQGSCEVFFLSPRPFSRRVSLWGSAGRTGRVDEAIDMTTFADGESEVSIHIRVAGRGTAIRSIDAKLWFMVSPHSLPALKAVGDNALRMHSGDRHGLHSMPRCIEYRFDQVNKDEIAFEETNVRRDVNSFSLINSADEKTSWSMVYELHAPHSDAIAWLTAYALFESRKPDDPEDQTPAKIEIADSPDGPWRTIAERPLAVHPQGWHFGCFGEGKFSGESETAFIRFSSKKGMKGFRIAAHYLPKEPPPADVPLEIEHAWYEDDTRVGRRLKTHVERTTKLAHEYVVRCGNTPYNESITMRVPSLKR